MLASSRVMKPKLSLSISTTAQTSARPSLSLKSPMVVMPRTPISPSPISPTARNTRLNQRGYSTMQQPTFAYANTSNSKSILKKNSYSQTPSSAASRHLQFREEPIVYCVTPIENTDDYYGAYTKTSKEERRWQRR